MEFFAAGRTKRERMLKAGNQQGKSEGGAFEIACHMTGEYPEWWPGKKFERPTKWWAVGVTSLVVRNVSQGKLCGPPGVSSEFGSGYIPRECFKDSPSLSRGVTDAYDTIQVIHKTNGVVDGISTCQFKSYEQGREKFQAETLDGIWWDEEPPMDIYTEGLTRTNAVDDAISFLTYTPMKGMSDVSSRFLNESHPDREVINMTILDAEHISEAKRQQIIDSYPAHEREARINGVPMMGEGKIFMVSEESIMEPGIQDVPPHWAKLWGIDFGIGHPFGAVLGLWDRDNDVIHIHHAFKIADQLPLQHATAMKKDGAAVPVAWPRDGTNRDQGSGEPLARQYGAFGLMMLPDHATHADGSVSTEAGILEMYQRMVTGRLKVANHLTEWFEEFRMYHRKDGQIVKVKDDIMSATRILVMMRRYARAVPLGSEARKRMRTAVAQNVDFDLFA